MSNYPNDEDGQVLASLAEMGVDMSAPLELEFAIDVDDEAAARRVAEAVKAKGYPAEVVFDDGEPSDELEQLDEEAEGFQETLDELEADEDSEPSWTVYVTKQMVPEYETIVAMQKELTELTEELGGVCDSWGAFSEE